MHLKFLFEQITCKIIKQYLNGLDKSLKLGKDHSVEQQPLSIFKYIQLNLDHCGFSMTNYWQCQDNCW